MPWGSTLTRTTTLIMHGSSRIFLPQTRITFQSPPTLLLLIHIAKMPTMLVSLPAVPRPPDLLLPDAQRGSSASTPEARLSPCSQLPAQQLHDPNLSVLLSLSQQQPAALTVDSRRITSSLMTAPALHSHLFQNVDSPPTRDQDRPQSLAGIIK